jgi:hypothetical protein
MDEEAVEHHPRDNTDDSDIAPMRFYIALPMR